MGYSLVRKLLKADGFLMVNRVAITAFGLDSAIVLAELMRWEDYFIREGKIKEGDSFYVTQSKFLENTTLTAKQLRRIIPSMQKFGILAIEKRGMPAKNYYQIKYNYLLQWLQKVTTGGDKRSPHTIKEIEEEMTTSETLSPSEIQGEKLPQSMEYTPIDEDGRETTVKRKGPKPEGKNKIAMRLQREFIFKCRKVLNTSPIMDVKGYKMCLYAMNTGGLTEKQVLDLFDEWFGLPKPDEELVSITRALSARQIEGYKVRNGVK